jgi:hypothetical protein
MPTDPTVPPEVWINQPFTVDEKYKDGAYHAHFVMNEDKVKEEGLTPDMPAFYDQLAVELQADPTMDRDALSEHYLAGTKRLVVILPEPHNLSYNFADNEPEQFEYLKGIVYDSNRVPCERVSAIVPPELGTTIREKRPGRIVLVALDAETRVIATGTLSYGELDGSETSHPRAD